MPRTSSESLSRVTFVTFGSDAVKWKFLVVGNAVMHIYVKATKNAMLIYKHKLRKRLMNEK